MLVILTTLIFGTLFAPIGKCLLAEPKEEIDETRQSRTTWKTGMGFSPMVARNDPANVREKSETPEMNERDGTFGPGGLDKEIN